MTALQGPPMVDAGALGKEFAELHANTTSLLAAMRANVGTAGVAAFLTDTQDLLARLEDVRRAAAAGARDLSVAPANIASEVALLRRLYHGFRRLVPKRLTYEALAHLMKHGQSAVEQEMRDAGRTGKVDAVALRLAKKLTKRDRTTADKVKAGERPREASDYGRMQRAAEKRTKRALRAGVLLDGARPAERRSAHELLTNEPPRDTDGTDE